MTLKTDSYQVGLDSTTDTNNFRIDTDGAGGFRVRRKSDGSGGTILTVDSSGRVGLAVMTTYANDAAAAAGGVAIGQLYRNGSVVQVRVT